MVLTRLPLMTTSRRPCACTEPPPPPALAPASISQLTKARLGPVFMVPLIGISVPLVLMTVGFGASWIPGSSLGNLVLKLYFFKDLYGGIGRCCMCGKSHFISHASVSPRCVRPRNPT